MSGEGHIGAGDEAMPPQPVLRRGRVALRPTQAADCDFVLAVESAPENARYVGQWSRHEHLACMRDSSWAHWIVEAGGTAVGYVVLEDVADPNLSLLLRRVVIRGKGRGHGSAAVRLVARYCFEVLRFHRLWLYVAVDNPGAIRLYKRLGFVREGTARDCERRQSGYVSMHTFSLLEQEYRHDLRRQAAGRIQSPR